MNNDSSGNASSQNPKLRRILKDDLRRGGFWKTVSRDFKEIFDFYIDGERKQRYAAMGVIKRWFYVGFWILKSLILKLTPGRRLLIMLSLILFFSFDWNIHDDRVDVQVNLPLFSYAILIFVLMLELKDKLLARSELEAGRAVQRALIPVEKPEIPGWDIWLHTESANEVGGDLIDCLTYRQDRFGVVLGDVSGKGLGAALFASQIQATLRALVTKVSSIVGLLSECNTIICGEKIHGRFISMIYLESSYASSEIRLCNAGHLPPLLIRDNGYEKVTTKSLAIGLSAKAEFSEQIVSLKEKDVVILYSDGITEAKNLKEEFFGDQRLLESITPMVLSSSENIGKSILSAVKFFIGDAPQSDDISVAVIKRRSL